MKNSKFYFIALTCAMIIAASVIVSCSTQNAAPEFTQNSAVFKSEIAADTTIIFSFASNQEYICRQEVKSNILFWTSSIADYTVEVPAGVKILEFEADYGVVEFANGKRLNIVVNRFPEDSLQIKGIVYTTETVGKESKENYYYTMTDNSVREAVNVRDLFQKHGR